MRPQLEESEFYDFRTSFLKNCVSEIDSKASPVITNIEVYKALKVLVQPEIRRDKNGTVEIISFDSGPDIFYIINSNVSSNQN